MVVGSDCVLPGENRTALVAGASVTSMRTGAVVREFQPLTMTSQIFPICAGRTSTIGPQSSDALRTGTGSGVGAGVGPGRGNGLGAGVRPPIFSPRPSGTLSSGLETGGRGA